MESDVLKRLLSATSLWEISLGFVLIAMAAGAVFFCSWQVTEQARARRTLRDMEAILEACRQYEVLHRAWPGSWAELRLVLPQLGQKNIWGAPFVIIPGQERVAVETDFPAGVVQRSWQGTHLVVQNLSGQDRVRLSTGRQGAGAARLNYEKRNVYGP